MQTYKAFSGIVGSRFARDASLLTFRLTCIRNVACQTCNKHSRIAGREAISLTGLIFWQSVVLVDSTAEMQISIDK